MSGGRQHRIVRLGDTAGVDRRDVAATQVIHVVEGHVVTAHLVRVFSVRRDVFRHRLRDDCAARDVMDRPVVTGVKLSRRHLAEVEGVRIRQVVADSVGRKFKGGRTRHAGVTH